MKKIINFEKEVAVLGAVDVLYRHESCYSHAWMQS